MYLIHKDNISVEIYAKKYWKYLQIPSLQDNQVYSLHDFTIHLRLSFKNSK